jgi:hypothetical protein
MRCCCQRGGPHPACPRGSAARAQKAQRARLPARLVSQIQSPPDRAIGRTEGDGDNQDGCVQLLADCQHLRRGLGHSARGEDDEEGEMSVGAPRPVHRLVPAKRAAHARGRGGVAWDSRCAERGPCTPASEGARQQSQVGHATTRSVAPRRQSAAGGHVHAGGGIPTRACGRAAELNTPRTSRSGIGRLRGGRGRRAKVCSVGGCVGAAREVGNRGRRCLLAAPGICSTIQVRQGKIVRAVTHANCTGRRSRRRAREVLELDERHGGRQEMMSMWRCSTLDLGVKNVT